MEKVKNTAEKGENLIPPILEAIKSYATIGELCNALRELKPDNVKLNKGGVKDGRIFCNRKEA